MNEACQVVSSNDTNGLPDSKQISGVLAKEGQLILSLVDLVEQVQCAIDDLVEQTVFGVELKFCRVVSDLSVQRIAVGLPQGVRHSRRWSVVYPDTLRFPFL